MNINSDPSKNNGYEEEEEEEEKEDSEEKPTQEQVGLLRVVLAVIVQLLRIARVITMMF